MQFADLNLAEPILRALATEQYTTPTPVQAQSIPLILEGRDLLATAQTGTGKTAAFALPILHRFLTSPRPENSRAARCLVLCPTRELATQIADGFGAYGRQAGIRRMTVFGGVNQKPQVDALRRGTDVLIATPGRLQDLIEQGHVDLRSIEVLVLDEADRMLDMGFIHPIRRIVALLPKNRQTLMFSATIPPEIRSLAQSLLRNAATVQIAPKTMTADGIAQAVYHVDRRNKPALLAHLIQTLPMSRAIVFTRTKHGADRVVRHLHARGIRAEAIHGNKSQNARQRALQNFKQNKTGILLATDIASRGIDVDDVTHVVNYDVTHEPETYVHRIGRTARAGASGVAISLCDPEERGNLREIEKLLRRSIPVRTDHPEYASAPDHADADDSHRPERARPQPRNPARSKGQKSAKGRPPMAPQPQQRRMEAPRRAPAAHPVFGHSRGRSGANHLRTRGR